MAIWDNITLATKKAGKEIVVFAEETDYYFGEHDHTPTNTNVGKFTRPSGSSRADACFKSVMFSCHDAGFDQGPGNYYSVRGSRAKLGYQGLFSYLIPVMYTGEEANLDPIYLPAVQKGCYSGGGNGGWYYGLDMPKMFSQVSTSSAKASMLNDTTHMLRIRSNESDLIHANMCNTSITEIPTSIIPSSSKLAPPPSSTTPTSSQAPSPPSPPSQPVLWIPYARFDVGKALIVCANPSNATAITLQLNITTSSIGLSGHTLFKLEDLWNTETSTIRKTADELTRLTVTVAKDGIARGGLAVIKITPVTPTLL